MTKNSSNQRMADKGNLQVVLHVFKERAGCEGGGKGYLGSDELAFTLSRHQDQNVMQPATVDCRNLVLNGNLSGTLQSKKSGGYSLNYQNPVLSSVVRRLTPLECERLQGFPDGHTDIPGASDSARYAAIGNSMTVNVMRWLGERIQLVDDTMNFIYLA